ncbi:MAG: DHHA1 domain-containing protein, partial [Candidatus Peribacteraceae bacterium]|nr:DHHA1 domain-containing protein [Candidatus Peribacteraceae bacterium]
RALNRIQVNDRAGIVWSAISREDLAEMGAESKEVSGILDELISTIPDADIHVMFTETEEGELKASLRSSPAIDVNRLAGKLFSGGGHPRAAGFRVRTYRNFQLAVLECVQKIMEGMTQQRAEVESAPAAPVPERPQPPAEQRVQEIAVERSASGTGEGRTGSGLDIVQSLSKLPPVPPKKKGKTKD